MKRTRDGASVPPAITFWLRSGSSILIGLAGGATGLPTDNPLAARRATGLQGYTFQGRLQAKRVNHVDSNTKYGYECRCEMRDARGVTASSSELSLSMVCQKAPHAPDDQHFRGDHTTDPDNLSKAKEGSGGADRTGPGTVT